VKQPNTRAAYAAGESPSSQNNLGHLFVKRAALALREIF